MLTAEWQGKPIWLVNRTDQQLKDLKSLDGAVTDPNSEVDHQPENCKKRDPFDQAEPPRRYRYLYPPGLLSDLPSRRCPCGFGRRLERRLLLPLPRFEIRHGRPRIQRCSCTDQLGCTALQISERYNCFGGRRLKIRNDNYGKPNQ